MLSANDTIAAMQGGAIRFLKARPSAVRSLQSKQAYSNKRAALVSSTADGKAKFLKPAEQRAAPQSDARFVTLARDRAKL